MLRIVLGAVSILFGILVLVWPGISLAILVILVAILGDHHRRAPNHVVGPTSAPFPTADGSGHHRPGALSILFGILVLIRPGAGLVSIIWIIGIWAIVWRITLIVLGVQLRKAATTSRGRCFATAWIGLSGTST